MIKPAITVVSDTHIHSHQQFSTIGPDGMNSRVKIVLDKLIEAANWSREHEVPYFVHLGDVFHTRDFMSYRVWNAAFETFRTVCSAFRYSYFIIGNHDILGNEAGYTIDAFRSIPNVMIVDKVIDLPLINGLVRLIPWLWKDRVTNPDIERMNEAFRDSPTKAILAHCPVKGAILNPLAGETWKEGVTVLPSASTVWIGHCHIRQQLTINAWHLGSLCPVTAAENNQPGGFGVINDDGSWSLVENDAPKFITLRLGDVFAEDSLKGSYVRVASGGTYTAEQAEKAGARSVIELEIETQSSTPVQWSRFGDLEALIDLYADENHGSLEIERLKKQGKEFLQ